MEYTHQAPLSSTVSQSLLKFMFTGLVIIAKYLIFCHPLLLPSTLSSIRVFSNESTMSWLFTPGTQSIGASASASVLPMNVQCWFLSGLTGLISLLSTRLSGVFSRTTVWKHQFFSAQLLWSNSHTHTWLMEKPEFWLYRPLSAKRCLCFLICCLCLS